MRLVGSSVIEDRLLVDTGGVSAIGQADRLLGLHKLVHLRGEQHIDRIRAAQMITLKLVILPVNEQVKKQSRHRGDARAFADAQ